MFFSVFHLNLSIHNRICFFISDLILYRQLLISTCEKILKLTDFPNEHCTEQSLQTTCVCDCENIINARRVLELHLKMEKVFRARWSNLAHDNYIISELCYIDSIRCMMQEFTSLSDIERPYLCKANSLVLW